MKVANISLELLVWLHKIGITGQLSEILCVVIILVGILIVSLLADFITKKILLTVIKKLAKKTHTVWDDILVDKKVFHKLSHIVPIIIVYYSINIAFPDSQIAVDFIKKAATIYLVIVLVMVLNAFLNGLNEIYNVTIGDKKGTSIKSYIQVVKIIAYIIAAISALSILLNKEVGYFITGLGAMTAVLLLIFKDSILGLVGGIQLTTNDMVRIGDWISMPARNADGIVLEVSLNTVKVQNWDNTISTIPTYALVTETFNNWRGMEESEGRRIKRAINLDMNSVKFCSPELLDKLSKFQILQDYIPQKSVEIEKHNKKIKADTSLPINGVRFTNIGIFRKYLEGYLKQNEKINSEMTLVVRQLAPGDTGIPMEIYGFSKIKSFVEFEEVQSDIFDHILAVVPEFELKVFQNPTGEDFRKGIGK